MARLKHYYNMGTVSGGELVFRRYSTDNTPRLTERVSIFSSVSCTVFPIALIPPQTETRGVPAAASYGVAPVPVIPPRTETADTLAAVSVNAEAEVN